MDSADAWCGVVMVGDGGRWRVVLVGGRGAGGTWLGLVMWVGVVWWCELMAFGEEREGGCDGLLRGGCVVGLRVGSGLVC